VDKEDFDKNSKGEYSISVEITDARTGFSYGKDAVSSPPGVGRDRALAFGKSIQVPEGAVAKYILTAKAKNGRLWTATGTAPVWTMLLNYPSGFQPVALAVSEDLAPADLAPQAEKGDQGGKGK
jgi:hypothetical protein